MQVGVNVSIGFIGLATEMGVRELRGSKQIGLGDVGLATMCSAISPGITRGFGKLNTPGLSGTGVFAAEQIQSAVTGLALGIEAPEAWNFVASEP